MKLASVGIGVVLIGLVVGTVDRMGISHHPGSDPESAAQQTDNAGAAIADRLLQNGFPRDWQ